MDKNKKYTWIFSDDNEMFFWSKSSTNRYLTSNTLLMPKQLIGRGKKEKIRTANENLPKIFERYGITLAGFSKKTKDYYQVIGRNKFFTMFIVEDGILPIKFFNKKKLLRKGDILLVPPKFENLTIQIERGFALIFWAHLDKSWCKNMQNSTNVKIIRNVLDSYILFNLAHAYESEVYSQNPSLSILENTVQALVEVLKRNIDVTNISKEREELIDRFLRQIIKKRDFTITAQEASKELSISVLELNSFCVLKYSMTFAKLMLKNRMFLAQDMLKSKMAVATVAKRLYYANPFVFSRSFKKYFGFSPSKSLEKPTK